MVVVEVVVEVIVDMVFWGAVLVGSREYGLKS